MITMMLMMLLMMVMVKMMMMSIVMMTRMMESTCISGSDCPPKVNTESQKKTSCHWANHLVVMWIMIRMVVMMMTMTMMEMGVTVTIMMTKITTYNNDGRD